jgi:hypothetical protein
MSSGAAADRNIKDSNRPLREAPILNERQGRSVTMVRYRIPRQVTLAFVPDNLLTLRDTLALHRYRASAAMMP